MSANAPFLAKYAKRLSEKEVESNLAKGTSEKGTYFTRVARETTDDR